MKRSLLNKGFETNKDGIRVVLTDSPDTKNQIKKEKKIKKIVATSVLSVLGFVLVLNLIILPLSSVAPRVDAVDTYSGDNKYICFDECTKISAHRAGGDLAPEQTMLAFELCMTSTEYKVDILEFDLHITKDNQLVLLHDHTVDRTSNSREVFGESDVHAYDKTYAELAELNFGYNFQAEDGSYPYREKDADLDKVRILLLDDVLEYVENYTSTTPDVAPMNYIIEIKDGDSAGVRAMDMLATTLEKFGIEDRTIVGSFQQNVLDHIDEHHPNLQRSSGIKDVLSFYFSFLYNVDLSKKDIGYSVMQIPYDQFVLNLGHKSVIDYAHSHDIAVQYWTINDEKRIAELVENGADAIITDNPEIAYEVVSNK